MLLQCAYLEGELEHSSKKQSREDNWKLNLEGFRVALGLVGVVVGSGCGVTDALKPWAILGKVRHHSNDITFGTKECLRGNMGWSLFPCLGYKKVTFSSEIKKRRTRLI